MKYKIKKQITTSNRGIKDQRKNIIKSYNKKQNQEDMRVKWREKRQMGGKE